MHRATIAALIAGACGATPAPSEPSTSGDSADPVRVDTVQLPGVTGLSGLTRDDRGGLWTVSERGRVLVEIPADGPPRALPIRGVPEYHDLESLAWLEQRRFALGTEGACEDGAHSLLIVRADGAAAVVERTVELALAPWGGVCSSNRGVEGACRAGDTLVVAIEEPGVDASGRRAAPVAAIDLATGDASAFWVGLTSETGKLSGIDCRTGDREIRVVAIERHFEVSHLIAFSLPTAPGGPAPREITARVVRDIWAETIEGKRNFEGISWSGDSATLITDNHWRIVTGPTELVELTVRLPDD